MKDLNPAHIQAVIKAINNGPFFKHLSIKVTEIGIGYSVVMMEIGKKHMNPFGGPHGGAYASGIDTAAWDFGHRAFLSVSFCHRNQDAIGLILRARASPRTLGGDFTPSALIYPIRS